ncbi:MAG TPA: hypothetical protein EYP58_01870 [bacterium (Candidatus Stahlbacteria)]|nr:hypothetical protein [Candidatus Stahlbacteria bacterium]
MFKGLIRSIRAISGKEGDKSQSPLIRTWVSLIITFVILGAGLYIILSPGYDGSVKKWAFGAVGAIIGYWLKD